MDVHFGLAYLCRILCIDLEGLYSALLCVKLVVDQHASESPVKPKRQISFCNKQIMPPKGTQWSSFKLCKLRAFVSSCSVSVLIVSNGWHKALANMPAIAPDTSTSSCCIHATAVYSLIYQEDRLIACCFEYIGK